MVSTLWLTVAIITLAPLIAGLLPLLGRHVGDRNLHTWLGIAAGAMLAVAFLRVLPRVFETGGEPAALTLGATFIGLYLLEGLTHLHGHSAHDDTHEHHEGDHFDHATRTPKIALLALGLHMLLDGIILPPAFHVSETVGISLAAAIALHKLPAGLATGTIASAANLGTRTGLLAVTAVVSMTAIGTLLGSTLLNVSGLTPHLLAIAAGTLLFVAVAELLPELHHGPEKTRVAIGLLIGFLAIPLLHEALAIAGIVGGH